MADIALRQRLQSRPPRGVAATADRRMLLVLDLDETLLHATDTPLLRAPDHEVFGYALYWRPGVAAFIDHVAKLFRLAVWTSSTLDYAEHVCALLFSNPALLEFIWARDKCTARMDWEQQSSCYAKSLRKLKRYGYDLRRLLMVDDSPEKHTRNYGNLIQVTPFTGDPADTELADLARYLSQLSMQPNARSIEKRGWRKSAAVKVGDAGA